MTDSSSKEDLFLDISQHNVWRQFELVTRGERREIDRLGIVTEVFGEMDDAERRAVLSYITEYWSYKERTSP